ncbi:MAG: VCBS repeat-containing protein [Deltaproteobacteria bacterium]|nr:VCBS repeat-containing protein [Deltaproteobacteria bacterium]
MSSDYNRSCRLSVFLVALVASVSLADVPRAPGSNTGDGSGPFSGLALAPEANLFAGAATTSIPIEVPPGRKGSTPRLALTYSSHGGPSAYGYGWDLPLGRIQRTTKHGVLPCSNSPLLNEFVVVLPEATVECTLDPATNLCRPAVEESFLRIEFVPGDNHWEVHDRSGVRYAFGENQASRTPVYPDCTTFAWSLTTIEDPNSNRINMWYENDSHVIYPQTIQYGGTSSLAHRFEISFEWEDRAPEDRILNSLNGFPAQVKRRLRRIEVRYPIGGRRVRWYGFHYAGDRQARQTLLSAVTLYDDNDQALSRADGLPASTTFTYHQGSPANGRFGFAVVPQSLSRPKLRAPRNGGAASEILRWHDRDDGQRRDVLDMNGDGFPDLVDAWPVHQLADGCTNSTAPASWDVYLGSPGGFASRPIPWSVPYQGLMCDVRRNLDTYTDLLTVDVTGDGIPDFVDARSTPWQVYPGTPHASGGGWGFGPVQTWSAAVIHAQESQVAVTIGNGGSNNDWHGAAVIQDLIDWNGDGLPDLVRAPGADSSGPWRVWLNTGNGFGAEEGHVVGSNVLAFNTDDDGQVAGTFDINGDSLPDFVLSQHASSGPYSGAWTVVLNTGRDINRDEEWPLPAAGSWRYIRKNQGDPVDTVRDLFDVNGDGLPDLVDTSGWTAGHKKWQVFLNRGAGFTQTAIEWDAPADRIRNSSAGGGRITADTFDVDGDGLVDYVDYRDPYLVYHSADGAWKATCDGLGCLTGVAPGVGANATGGRVDLLEQLENGVGGSIALSYRPSSQWDNTDENGVPHLPMVLWTVSRIERDDGLCASGTCLTGGEHTSGADFSYAYGRYDPVARELRGFRTVRQTDATGVGRTTTFFQDAARAGKIEDSTGPFDAEHHEWECVDPATEEPLGCPQTLDAGVRRWVRLQQTDHYDYGTSGNYKHAWTQNLAWDTAGNITHVRRSVDGIATAIDTLTRFAALGVIADRPQRLRVESGGTTLQEEWFEYDGSGNLSATRKWLDQTVNGMPAGNACPETPHAGAGTCVTSAMTYDSYGNLVTAIDANGAATVTTYDPETHIYPRLVANAAGHAVQTIYDPGCGTLLRKTNSFLNGQAAAAQPYSENTYDGFCRLQTVAAPRLDAGPPLVSRILVHLPGAPASPTAILQFNLNGGDPSQPATWVWSQERQFFDAFGRMLQVQRTAVVDGRTTLVTSGAVEVDARGNPAVRYGAFESGGGFEAAPPANAGKVIYTYDAANRVTSVTNPDGTVRTTETPLAWQTVNYDECFAANTCQGQKTVETRDAFGHVVEQSIYRGPRLASRTAFLYDGLGRLLVTKQGRASSRAADNTAVVTTYDSLGRKIRVVDPDSGTQAAGVWTYGYDLAGNLLYQDDPKGDGDTPPSPQHVQYSYDALNRVIRKAVVGSDSYCNLGDGQCAARIIDRIDFAYDQTTSGACAASCASGNCSLGKVAAVDERNGNSTRFCYDVRGRQSRIESLMVVDGRSLATDTRYTYDVADHVRTLRYPDGEVVTHSYDAAGKLQSLDGTDSEGRPVAYLVDMQYDQFGRVRSVVHGNDTADTLSYWGADKSFRLQQITSTSLVALQNLRYDQYQANGMLTRLTDVLHAADSGDPLSNSATFGYDGIGQLSSVDENTMVAGRYRTDDKLRNLRLKSRLRFSYKRTHPHQPIRVGSQRTAYDGNGNQTVGSDGVRQYHYTAEDHLERIDLADGRSVQLSYDYTGGRIAMRRSDSSGEQVTRYVADLVEVTPQYLTKHYYAGGLHIASQRVVTPPILLAQIVPPIQLAEAGSVWPIALRRDVHNAVAAAGIAGLLLLTMLPGRRRSVVGMRVRHGSILLLVIVHFTATLTGPWAVSRAEAQTGADETLGILHYHHDHLGSTQTITRADGGVFRHLRYTPYGEVRGSWDGSVVPASGCAVHGYCREFTGYDSEPFSGLQYANARFYDPVMGMYLTHDPMRQFANPYSYTGWNPVNAADPDGQFAFFAVIAFVLISAAASAAINTVAAAAQGASLSQIGKAAVTGAVTGAVGAGLGVMLSAVNIGLSALAGTLPSNVTLNSVLDALGEVAARSAVSTTISDAAQQTASGLGAPDEVTILAGLAGGYGGSAAYDTLLASQSGLSDLADSNTVRPVSSSKIHSSITYQAARQAGYNDFEARSVEAANLKVDGPSGRGFLGFLKGLTSHEVLNNESHFGFGAQKAFAAAEGRLGSGGPFLSTLGQASHYLQDQYALGHIFPGTHLLAGRAGWIFRGFVHQTFGGEITFTQESYDATVRLFSSRPS